LGNASVLVLQDVLAALKVPNYRAIDGVIHDVITRQVDVENVTQTAANWYGWSCIAPCLGIRCRNLSVMRFQACSVVCGNRYAPVSPGIVSALCTRCARFGLPLSSMVTLQVRLLHSSLILGGEYLRVRESVQVA
jgi:hypothetical protein